MGGLILIGCVFYRKLYFLVIFIYVWNVWNSVWKNKILYVLDDVIVENVLFNWIILNVKLKIFC